MGHQSVIVVQILSSPDTLKECTRYIGLPERRRGNPARVDTLNGQIDSLSARLLVAHMIVIPLNDSGR